MEFIAQLFAFFNGPNVAVIFAALFALSEALALIPSIKSNSVFQAIVEGLKKLKDFFIKA